MSSKRRGAPPGESTPQKRGSTTQPGAQDLMGNAAISEAISGPFDPALNAALGESFGTSMGGLSVSTGDDASNKAIGAAASTTGSDISLSSMVSEDMDDGWSMEVLAHEVAHSLAGGGTGEDLIDQPGDAGEAKADAAGAKFRSYVEGGMEGRAPSLRPATGGKAATHRWSLEGPWNKKDPGHEVLTLETLKKATEGTEPSERGDLLRNVGGIGDVDRNLDATEIDKSTQEFVRGAIWNDDPKMYLFDDETGTEDFSSGLMWFEEFDEDEKDESEELIARSHYGDLQYLHGMADVGEDPKDTQKKVMDWARFTAMVAKGEIPGNTKIEDLPDEQFKALKAQFAEGQAGWTVKDLFAGGQDDHDEFTDDLLKQRATGSLLHMIQDTYCDSHTERNEDGEIVQYRSYAGQDEKKHAAQDVIGAGNTVAEKAANLAGAQNAINSGADVLRMLDNKEISTEQVMKHLGDNVFNLADRSEQKLAGPGEKYAEEGWYDSHDDKISQAVDAPMLDHLDNLYGPDTKLA